jgi:dTDP-4-dehydrorhamnose reductase
LTEEAETQPINVYGSTKGEEALQKQIKMLLLLERLGFTAGLEIIL